MIGKSGVRIHWKATVRYCLYTLLPGRCIWWMAIASLGEWVKYKGITSLQGLTNYYYCYVECWKAWLTRTRWQRTMRTRDYMCYWWVINWLKLRKKFSFVFLSLLLPATATAESTRNSKFHNPHLPLGCIDTCFVAPVMLHSSETSGSKVFFFDQFNFHSCFIYIVQSQQ